MRDPTEAAVIAELERAELAARERRLAAEADADRLVEAAHRSVREIEAGVDARAADALEELRHRHLDRAAEEVTAIEAELARLDERSAIETASTPVFDAAVEQVVAAVLGERDE